VQRSSSTPKAASSSPSTGGDTEKRKQKKKRGVRTSLTFDDEAPPAVHDATNRCVSVVAHRTLLFSPLARSAAKKKAGQKKPRGGDADEEHADEPSLESPSASKVKAAAASEPENTPNRGGSKTATKHRDTPALKEPPITNKAGGTRRRRTSK
jgi:hypothetical protein